MLVEQGYAAMSIDGVAAAAGVGKTTIYRRYPGKRELAQAVVEHFAPVADLPRLGNARDELLAVVRRASLILGSAEGARLIMALIAGQGNDPELRAFVRSAVVLPRRAMVRGILERGIERGEVRADLDLELVIDMVSGAFFAHHLAGSPTPADWGDRLVEMAWRLIGSAGD
jgi:AcrR family transcriptional regulator